MYVTFAVGLAATATFAALPIHAVHARTRQLLVRD